MKNFKEQFNKIKFLIPSIVSVIVGLIIYLTNIDDILKAEIMIYSVLIGILLSHYFYNKNYKTDYQIDLQKVLNWYVLVFLSSFLLVFNLYLFLLRPKGYINVSVLLNVILLPFLLDVLFSLTKNLLWKIILFIIFIINFCALVLVTISIISAAIMFSSNPDVYSYFQFFFAVLFLPFLLTVIIIVRKYLPSKK